LANDTVFDSIVIGGGIAGASVAAELQASMRVLLLEREERCGYHTTGRSAAVYLKSYGNAVIRGLTRASEDFYGTPPEGFADTPLLRGEGAMMIAREDQMARLETELEAARRFVPAVRRLDAAGVRALVPSLREGYAAGGFLDPDARDMDVAAMLDGYLRLFRARGGRIATDAEVLNLERTGEVWRVTTRAGTFEAAVVVDAAGAWADGVAGLAGLAPLGLEPKRRTAFLVAPPEGADMSRWPVVTADIDEKFYFRPDAGMLFCSPADETPSPPTDARPEELDIALAVERIEAALAITIRRIAHQWAGLRTFAPDRTPVVGFDPRARGFFWLAGQGGYGIQTAPAMARIGAGLVTGTALDAEAADLARQMAPDRLIEFA